MSLADDLKAKADLNGDGKLSAEDLESLKDGANNEQIEKIKEFADQNGDGKVDLEDVKNIDLGNLANTVKEHLGGLFGGK